MALSKIDQQAMPINTAEFKGCLLFCGYDTHNANNESIIFQIFKDTLMVRIIASLKNLKPQAIKKNPSACELRELLENASKLGLKNKKAPNFERAII